MKRITGFTLIGVCLAGTIVAAESSGQGRGRKHGHERGSADARTRADVQVAFVSGDVVIIRDHYAPRYRNLPPGLQKKVARGGQLPPGWQKKLEPFPVAIERRLTPLPSVYRRGVIDGHAVIYDSRSSVIVDLAVLF
jgi:hypothetical protein